MALREQISSRRDRIVGSLAIGFLVEIVNRISPLIVLGLAQSRMGLDQFGAALFAISVIEIFFPIVSYGYTYHGALKIARIKGDTEAQSRLMSEILSLRLFHAMVACLALFVATRVLPSWQEHATTLMKLLPFLLLSALDMTYVNIGLQRMSWLSFSVGGFKLLNLGLVYFLIQGPSDIDLYAVLMMLANGGVSMMSAFWVFRHLKFSLPRMQECRTLFVGSFGLAAVVFLYPLYERFDILVVQRVLTEELLGSYNATWRLVMSVVPLFMVIATTFLSENMAESDEGGLERGAHQALWLSLALTIPIIAAAPFLAGDVLVFVYGEELRSSHWLFVVQTLSILAEVILCILGMQIMLLRKKLKLLAIYMSVGIVCGAVLSWFFLKHYGVLGGAAGALLGRLVCVGLISWNLRSIVSALPGRDYRDIILAAVGMVAFLSILPAQASVLWVVPAGGSLYLLGLAYLQSDKIQMFVRRK